jgi:hypothetical protein
MNVEELVVEFNGVKYITPCFAIVLYTNIYIDENTDNIEDVIRPYDIFISEFKKELGWCIYSFNQNRPIRAKENHFSLYREWLLDPKKRRKGNFTLEFWSGRTAEEWNSPGIFINYERYNYTGLLLTEIALPIPWVKDNNIGIYIKNIINNYPLSYGYAGWALLKNHYSVDQEELIDKHLNAWLLRYPGLLAPLPSSFIPIANETLPDIGCITLFNKRYVEKIGGQEELLSKVNLIQGLRSEVIGDNLIFMLGNNPALGDSVDGDLLPIYCEMGKILSPLHNGDLIYERAILPGFSNDRLAGKKWVNRFFGE